MFPETALTVQEVATVEALDAIRSEWNVLWAHCPGATPFQSPAWLIPWWRHVGEGDLWTLALRQEGRLVGLALLYVYTQLDSGRRDVFPLGIATTDYLDALFAPGYEHCGPAAVWAHLDGQRGRWDVCDIPQLRPGSPLLSAPTPADWQEETSQSEPCPVLTLPAAEEELSGLLPKRLRDNLRYYERRAVRIGPVRVESATRDNLDMFFEALLRLHGARWSSRGEAGVLSDGAVQRAHREALPDLLDLGVLRLYGLWLGERLAAVYYGLADADGPGKRAYYYLSGFDPELASLSPGTLIIGHALREAVREGAQAFDFLRGQEAYKYLWGARDAPNFRRRLVHPGGRRDA